MMSSHVSHPVALPKCWTRHVRSALLQAISLAATAWTLARSRAATSRRQRKRLQVALPNYGVGAALGSCKVFPCHWIGTVSASRESLDHYSRLGLARQRGTGLTLRSLLGLAPGAGLRRAPRVVRRSL